MMIMLAFLFTGCGVFKKNNKTLSKSDTVVKVDRDSVSVNVVEKRDIDRGVVVTETEKVIERVAPPKKATVKTTLKPGRNIVMDSVLNELVLTFDSLTNGLMIEVYIPEVKETETIKERKTENKDRESTEVSKDSATIRSEEEYRSSTKDTEKVSTPNYSWILWLAAALLLAFILLRRRF